MALSTEETADLNESYNLLSAEELRGQLGDDPDHDVLINAILGEGKAVETKGAAEAQAGHGDADGTLPVAGTKKDQADAEEDDEPDEVVDAHGNPVALDADGKVVAAADADDGADDDAAIAAAAAPAAAVVDDSANVPALSLAFVDTKFESKLAELDDAKAINLANLMDGTMTPADYSKAEAKYMRDRDTLRDDATFEKQWFTQVHTFKVDCAKTTGINYDTDAEKGQALDDWVKRLGSKPENDGKEPGWFLEQAHKKVMAEFDIVPVAAKQPEKAAKTPVAANKVAEKTGRAPNLSQIPPTLGGLPAAAEADSGGSGEFAHLDRLSGMDYENALARMTPEQKNRYEMA